MVYKHVYVIQVHFGDSTDSVPDHHDKASITIK